MNVDRDARVFATVVCFVLLAILTATCYYVYRPFTILVIVSGTAGILSGVLRDINDQQ